MTRYPRAHAALPMASLQPKEWVAQPQDLNLGPRKWGRGTLTTGLLPPVVLLTTWTWNFLMWPGRWGLAWSLLLLWLSSQAMPLVLHTVHRDGSSAMVLPSATVVFVMNFLSVPRLRSQPCASQQPTSSHHHKTRTIYTTTPTPNSRHALSSIPFNPEHDVSQSDDSATAWPYLRRPNEPRATWWRKRTWGKLISSQVFP